jgi:hypothetical protein
MEFIKKTQNTFKAKIDQCEIFRQEPAFILLPVPGRYYLTAYCESDNV